MGKNSSEIESQVVVVGGGVAGVSAAIGAARTGAHVTLIEKYGFLGGVASSAWVGTICGSFLPKHDDEALRFGVGTYPKEFTEAVQERSGLHPTVLRNGLVFLPCSPKDIASTLSELLQPLNIRLLTHSTLFDCKADGSCVTELRVLSYTEQKTLRPSAVIDATGESLVSSLAGLPVHRFPDSQAASFSVLLDGGEDTSLRESLGAEISLAVMRAELGVTASVLPYAASMVLKITSGKTPQGADEVITEEQLLRSRVEEVLSVIRAEVPGCDAIRVSELTPQIGVRVGSVPDGRETLTSEAVKSSTLRADGVARGCWPIERWMPNGSVQLIPLAGDHRYDIPAGSLRASRCDNLWFAGRAFSAESDAAASARVIGTALGTGYAAGALAAGYVNGQNEQETVDEIRREQQL